MKAFILTNKVLSIPKTSEPIHVYYRNNKSVCFNYFGRATNGLLHNQPSVSYPVPEKYFVGMNRHKKDAIFHYSGRKRFDLLDMEKEWYTKEEILEADPIFNWKLIID